MNRAVCWLTAHPVRATAYIVLISMQLGAARAIWQQRQ